MKKVVLGSRKREQQLEANGWTFKTYEYDYDAQVAAENFKKQGFDVQLLRETSDTPGLKMYSVWVKELNPEVDRAVLKYLPKYQQLRLTFLKKEKDLDGTSYWWSMNPNPDDDIQEEVQGHSYGLDELKYDIDQYIKHNKRLGWDY